VNDPETVCVQIKFVPPPVIGWRITGAKGPPGFTVLYIDAEFPPLSSEPQHLSFGASEIRMLMQLVHVRRSAAPRQTDKVDLKGILLMFMIRCM
jgi:hypothetical protein